MVGAAGIVIIVIVDWIIIAELCRHPDRRQILVERRVQFTLIFQPGRAANQQEGRYFRILSLNTRIIQKREYLPLAGLHHQCDCRLTSVDPGDFLGCQRLRWS